MDDGFIHITCVICRGRGYRRVFGFKRKCRSCNGHGAYAVTRHFAPIRGDGSTGPIQERDEKEVKAAIEKFF